MPPVGCLVLNRGDDRLRAEWLLTFAPIIGLGTNCLMHILCRKVWGLRTGYTLVCGFLLGLVIMAVAVAANVPAAISTTDLAGLWATLGFTYVALAFGFWAFLNLNMTSLRIRILRELLHSEDGMSRAELFGQYSAEEFLHRRLARLERSGDLAFVDGHYSLGSQKLLYVDHCLKILRAIIFAGTARRQGG
jgi:hypothetical protein